MKPRAYLCKKTALGAGCGKEVPLDHWHSGSCPRPPMPLPWIFSILGTTMGDTDHVDGKVSATRLTNCPRKVLIEDFVTPEHPGGGLVFDPSRLNSANFGNAVHAWMEKWTPEGAYKEIKFPVKGQKAPILDLGEGVKIQVRGTVDWLAPDTVCMNDYKTHSETAHRFKFKFGGAAPELRAQFSIYKALIEDAIEGATVKKARVWHGAQTSAKHPCPPWFDQEVAFMTMQDVGSIKPFGADFTIRDIAGMYNWALHKIGEIPHKQNTKDWFACLDAILCQIPLVGEKIFRGTMCTTYCGSAQPHCYVLAGRPQIL